MRYKNCILLLFLLSLLFTGCTRRYAFLGKIIEIQNNSENRIINISKHFQYNETISNAKIDSLLDLNIPESYIPLDSVSITQNIFSSVPLDDTKDSPKRIFSMNLFTDVNGFFRYITNCFGPEPTTVTVNFNKKGYKSYDFEYQDYSKSTNVFIIILAKE